MIVEFVEKYVPLSAMEAGDTATSKDRTSFFICGYYYDPVLKNNVKVIHDVNDLTNQYTEKRDLSQPIKILKGGDKFICRR